VEEPTICKSGPPTQDGGRSSNTEDKTSLTSRTRRFLISQEEETLKAKRLSSMVDTTNSTRDGELSTLTRKLRFKLEAITETLDGLSTDHSTLDQECQ
jgi:hypothetical protein